MNRDELLRLREEITVSARQLALESDAEPSDKIEVLMGLIRSGDASLELLTQAYKTSQQLTQDADKLNVFLDIIYEIDAKLVPDGNPKLSAAGETEPADASGTNQE